MKATLAEKDKYLEIISDTPQRIARAIQGVDEGQLRFQADSKSWSVVEIVVHLRSCADVWTHSIYAMLTETDPVLPDINERKWAKVTRYLEQPFSQSFQALVMQRENLVRVLKMLPLESWERGAIIFERRHTVFTQTRRMAKHESEHCLQMEELLSKT